MNRYKILDARALRAIRAEIAEERRKLKEKWESIADQQKGKWIRLGGKGIIDGLKQKPCKAHFYRILGIDEEGLILRAYRAKKSSRLPERAWDQECEIKDNIKTCQCLRNLTQFNSTHFTGECHGNHRITKHC